MIRHTWFGVFQLNNTNIPVKAYTARDPKKRRYVAKKLHADCHCPVITQKICPIHGAMDKSDLVTGYEHSHGQFVAPEVSELNELKPKSNGMISVDRFVPRGSVAPMFYSGTTYYLLPDGVHGEQRYRAVHQAMRINSASGSIRCTSAPGP